MSKKRNDIPFTTGAHLQAMECTIEGKSSWRWVVVFFEDDTYINGKVVDLKETGKTEAELYGK